MLLLKAALLGLTLFAFACVGGRHTPKLTRCTSGISSIRVDGNRTVRGPVVWFPKGCTHP